jgi:membrane protease YdiL (CAAX protease family)
MHLASVIAVLLATNVLTNRLPVGLYLPTCLAGAALLLLISRGAGLDWADLGLAAATVRAGLRWAGVAAAVVLIGYLVCLALPATRQVFADQRATGVPVGAVLWRALVRVPFGTVVLEEVAFRGVLWALVASRLGHGWATAISSALFGLWHVLPSLGITRANAAATAVFGPTRPGQVAAVLAAVAGTAVAGVLLCELRRRSGSLLAPAGLHCAANSLGYLLAWAAGR